MKVLMMASYFYKRGMKGFEKNKTGYGLLIPEIAMSVGASNTVLLLTYRNTRQGRLESEYGSCVLLDHPLLGIDSFNLNGIKYGIKCFISDKSSLKERLHKTNYWMSYGHAVGTIHRNKPDIAHINNICEPFIQACIDTHTPYIVSLHGLIGFLPDVSESIRIQEKKFIIEQTEGNKYFTVISSGIKKRIESNYLNGMQAPKILVIPNGTDIQRRMYLDCLDKPRRRNIVTVIGSICDRKNQIQVLEAIDYLGERFSNWELHLCGSDCLNGKLQEYAKKHCLENRVIFHGFIDPSEIDVLLNTAKLNIVASKDEGFGISMIEAFLHGVPTVTFSDLDAVEDIYNPKAMLLCSTRNTEELAETIYSAMNKKWSQEDIINHAMKFSLQNMAIKYISAYEKVLSQSGVCK